MTLLEVFLIKLKESVMLRKLFVSVMLCLPFSMTLANYEEVKNIDDLRTLCESLDAKEQVKVFDKDILCKGTHTVWKKRTSTNSLPNKVKVEANTSYEKSESPYKTPRDVRYSVSETGISCNVYDKYKVTTPQVPVRVETCSDLNAQNIENLCREAINQRCEEALQAKTESSPALEADETPAEDATTCSMELVDSFDTCNLYKKVK